MKALAISSLWLSFALTGVLSGSLALSDTGAAQFPQGPDASLTPGVLCTQPTEYRYPEHIAYCSRSVSTGEKRDVIKTYDTQLGYQVEQMNRQDFKIDHYVPLCMGGGNDPSNLWPQHKSIYPITDPLEEMSCLKMAAGKLKQDEAIRIIKQAKNHLDEAPGLMSYVSGL